MKATKRRGGPAEREAGASVIQSRMFAGEADYAQMRSLLMDLAPGPSVGAAFTVGDLDWQRFTANDPMLMRRVRLWHDGERLIGFVWPIDQTVDIMIRPGYPAVWDEMLDWAEGPLQSVHTSEPPSGKISVYVPETDPDRQSVLQARGYERHDDHYRCWRRPVDGATFTPVLPPDYTIRDMRGATGAEIGRRVEVHRAAFAPSRMTVAKHLAVMAAPTYRPDLDLIAVSPEGMFAAYCIVWFDPVNRLGVFEPVGCDPAFQRRGLAKAVLHEGMRRLAALGATTASVLSSGDSPAANALYAAAGFANVDRIYSWTLARPMEDSP